MSNSSNEQSQKNVPEDHAAAAEPILEDQSLSLDELEHVSGGAMDTYLQIKGAKR